MGPPSPLRRLLVHSRLSSSDTPAPALTVARDVLEEAPSQSINLPVADPTKVMALIMVTEWTTSACNVMQPRVRIDENYCMHNIPGRCVDGSVVLPIGSVLSLAIATLAFQPRARSLAQLT